MGYSLGREAPVADVLEITTALVSVPSITGAEHDVMGWIAQWLGARGWRVVEQEVTPGRNNVWAMRDTEAQVTLSTHLDTVPPFLPARVEGGRLYGRGACDAKGIAAAMLAAADRLVQSGESRVGLLFVVGEEEGSDGARAANQLATKSRFLINGEPTESRMATGAKGSLRIVVRTTGREAHSAYPELGRSAIEPLVGLLARLPTLALPTDPVLGETTINIGIVRGGSAANVIPGHAEAELLARVVGPVDQLRAIIDQWAGSIATVKYGAYIPPQRFRTVAGFDTAPMAYTSDIPLLDRWGSPLLYGPGSIHVAHTPEEYIDIAELRASVDAYERLVRMLLES
jgi:acetylornithine deacetylase